MAEAITTLGYSKKQGESIHRSDPRSYSHQAEDRVKAGVSVGDGDPRRGSQQLWGDAFLHNGEEEERFCHSHQHLPLTKPAGRQLDPGPQELAFPEPAPCLIRQGRGMAGNRSEHITIRP